MSIFNDQRRYSDDPAEYLEWKQEVAWESRREAQEYKDDDVGLVIDMDEEGGADDI